MTWGSAAHGGDSSAMQEQLSPELVTACCLLVAIDLLWPGMNSACRLVSPNSLHKYYKVVEIPTTSQPFTAEVADCPCRTVGCEVCLWTATTCLPLILRAS